MSEHVFPTKNNLINTKRSLHLAKIGYDLMDKKRSILMREIMELIDRQKAIESEISEKYSKAYDALKKAYIETGDCETPAESIPVDNSVSLSSKSVMGVEVPSVSVEKQPLRLYYAFATTTAALDDAYESFNEVKLLTVKLAETENAICRLADAIKKTRKRSNALGNIMIPEFENTVKYITNALEEKEREEFSRLKVIKTRKEQSS